MRSKTAAIWILGSWIGMAGTLQAQNKSDSKSDFTRLQSALKQDDKVTVTNDAGDRTEGRLVEISADRMVLETKIGQQTFQVPQIAKVQKKKNGFLLGAVVGGAAGLVLGLISGSIISNEIGGSAADTALPMALLGAGIGIGIDSLIGSNKTLYDRTPKSRVTISPIVDGKGKTGARIAFKF